MKFSIRRLTAAVVTTSFLLALVCLTAAHAQDADESGTGEALSSPSVAQVAGTWTGTNTEVHHGQIIASGPMTLDLTQNQKQIGGTFSLSTGTETPSGNVKGTILRNHLTLTFHATSGTNHKCSAIVVANVVANTMSGTYLVQRTNNHCKGKGTFDLTM